MMAHEGEIQCVVCRKQLQVGDSVVAVFECKHFRHDHCSSLSTCPQDVDGVHKCPFDNQTFDLSKWQDGKVRKFKDGDGRYMRLQSAPKSACNYRNMAWIFKHVKGDVDTYKTLMRKAAQCKTPDVTALLELAKLKKEGIVLSKDEENAQTLESKARELLEILKANNSNLLLRERTNTEDREESHNQVQEIQMEPSDRFPTINLTKDRNGSIKESGSGFESSEVQVEEIANPDINRNSSSFNVVFRTSTVTLPKDTTDDSTNSVESDESNSQRSERHTIVPTSPVPPNEQLQNRIEEPVIQHSHTIPEERSTESDVEEPINDKESVTLQLQQNDDRLVPLLNGNMEVLSSRVPSETISNRPSNFTEAFNYASFLETGNKVIRGYKLQTFKWVPKGHVNGVVLLLHGLHVHTRFDWLGLHDREEGSLVGALLNRGLAVYAYDAPAHGRRVDGFHANLKSLDVLRDIVVEMTRSFLPDTVDAERRILIGKGLGASIGIMVSLLDEGLFHGMCLMSPTVGQPDHKFGVAGKLLTRTVRTGLSKLIPNNVRVPVKLVPTADRVLRVKMLEDPLVYTGGLRAGMGKAFLKFFHTAQQVQAKYSHVAVFIGSEDNITSPVRMEDFYNRIISKDKKLYRYDDLGHYLLHEHGSDQVINDIVSWVCTQLSL